jgi:hypothetical protein
MFQRQGNGEGRYGMEPIAGLDREYAAPPRYREVGQVEPNLVED